MTLDNDANPTPHAPRFPSDAPPREGAGQGGEGAQTGAGGVAAPARAPIAAPVQSTDRPDATTPRGVARAILAGLSPAERAAVVAAVLAWCRGLAGLAAAVAAGLTRPSALAMADACSRVLVGDSTEVSEVDALDPAPFAPCMAVVGAWWQSGPYDLAREVAAGGVGSADFADALAFLGGLDETGETGERPADAPTLPRVERVELPAGVERVDAPRAGTTFLPPAPPVQTVTRAELVSLAARAARELGAVDHDETTGVDAAMRAAERATLAVFGEAERGGGPCADNAAEAVARMAEELAGVAALQAMAVALRADRSAATFCDRAGATLSMLAVAADAMRTARALALDAPGNDLDAARWPADDRGAA